MVSVEALHLFYTRTRDVVGCWMTRVLREEAIEDNLGYVARVLEDVRRDPAAGDGVVFAGFSQGVAMAYRAAARAGATCRGLVALGSDMPPDVAESRAVLPPILLGRGDDRRVVHARAARGRPAARWTGGPASSRSCSKAGTNGRTRSPGRPASSSPGCAAPTSPGP